MLSEADKVFLNNLRETKNTTYNILLKNHHPEHYKNIQEIRDKISNIIGKECTFGQAFYHYINEHLDIGICEFPGCDKQTSFSGQQRAYRTTCCLEHGVKLEARNLKISMAQKVNPQRVKDTIQKETENILNNDEINILQKNQTADEFVKFTLDHNTDIANIHRLMCSLYPALVKSINCHFPNISYHELFHSLKNKSERTLCLRCKETFPKITKDGYPPYCGKCNAFRLNAINRFKRYPTLYNFAILNEYTPIDSRMEFTFPSDNIVKKGIKVQCNRCGEFRSIATELINKKVQCKCRSNVHSSRMEKEIIRFVAYHIDIIPNDRSIIHPYELDIVVPEAKLAIEFNGVYWHSDDNMDKYYHLIKTNKCLDQGIQLIHIFEDEWLYKNDIVKSCLLAKLGKLSNKIYARKCEVREVSSKDKDVFLLNNHLQGTDKSKIRLGLYFENELVSIMTFGRRQISHTANFELLRFCSKLNTSVVGAAQKLFSYFIKNYEFEEIKTYADRRWSNGELYKTLGFTMTHISPVNYWYIEGQNRVHRVNFQKHKLKDKLEKFDPMLTEWENMQNNGYRRIWDCGNYVYSFKKNK